MADGQVTFQISVDAKDSKKSIDNIVKEFENAGVKVDKVADGMSSDISKSFGHAFDVERVKNFAINAAKAVANFAKEAVQAASDLAEVQNVVDVTFGQDASVIDEWSKNAGKQFGLTETQAKRFTSTLGAMMKSAGLAGSEITKMSTDMAGLAADMASFYNLDFDTAFQKIRSGISGEVEPLKALGINLSAANLEAFRLSQGIEKSYNSMSQGEQVVLRYQYLMQATADAQGDFERTSDGFANATRMLETNIEQLKTNVGTALLPIVNDVVGFVNDVFAALQVDLPEETVLDKIAAINLKTEDKIAEIKKTANEARALVSVMDKISGKNLSADSLVTFVDSFKGALDDLSWPLSLAKSSDYAGTISALADSLELKTGTKASDWSNLLNGVAGALADVKIEKNAAAYGFDTDRVFLSGDSAGGHLVLLYAMLQGNEGMRARFGTVLSGVRVRAAAATCPAFRLQYDGSDGDGAAVRFLCHLVFPDGVTDGELDELDVLRLIPESEYPPLIVTATPSDQLLYGEDLVLARALEENGRPYSFRSWTGKANKLDHVFNVLFPELEESREANRAIVDFFRAYG